MNKDITEFCEELCGLVKKYEGVVGFTASIKHNDPENEDEPIQKYKVGFTSGMLTVEWQTRASKGFV